MGKSSNSAAKDASSSSIGVIAADGRVDFDTDAIFVSNVKKMDDEAGGGITPATSTSSSPALPPSLAPTDVDDEPLKLTSLDTASNLTVESDDTGDNSPLSKWVAPASSKSLRTHNPIRAIVDPIMASSIKCGKERGDGKDQISLALGDPTAYGNMPPCPAIISAITKALQSPITMGAGYINACGSPRARAAIANHHSNLSKMEDGKNVVEVSADDVIVANGASGALELALTALLDEDSVLLVPRPGFPLYQVIAESHGASVVHYDLLPNQRWECDLDHMEAIIQGEEHSKKNTKVVRGILINNPSNPTGAVYSEEHLMGIIKLADKYQVPIIADEIYGDMTFGTNTFCPMANVAAKLGCTVPVITASGLGKQYLVPGWRLGWIVFHDTHHGAIQEVKKGAQRLAQVILGASHLAQVAIPAVLDPTSEDERESISSWRSNLYAKIESQVKLLCRLLNECHGLEVISPEGAMYAMVRIEVDRFDDLIVDDVSFMKLLLEEENIVVLPGCAFGLDANNASTSHVFRVVFCAPEHILSAASDRIASFCLRHKSV